MKFITSFALIVYCLITVNNCKAQWQPDIPLTFNPPSTASKSLNGASSIASNGNFIHVVWTDSRIGGRYKVFYRRSTNGGTTWEAEVELTFDPPSSGAGNPAIAVSGSVVLIVWYDTRGGTYSIYYRRSTDNGSSWGLHDTELSTNGFYYSTFPAISISGSIVHVVWQDTRDPSSQIYYNRSTDLGLSWGQDTRLTNGSFHSFYPSIAVSGSAVHVVWQDDRDGNGEIYYKQSTDNGITWGQDTRLTINASESQYPSVYTSGSFIHVLWQDARDPAWQVYYKRSTDGGISWGQDTRLTTGNNNAFSPSVYSSGSNVHIVWPDFRNGKSQVYYKLSSDAGTTWGADTRLTNTTSNSFLPSISVSSSLVHIVWLDDRDGNNEIYYKRNPNGNLVGIVNINPEIPKNFFLFQNYPNPFNPNSKIKFQIAKLSDAKLFVFDVLGHEVEKFVYEQLNPGTYEVDFDGSQFASGIYYYKISAGDYTDTKKMILIK